MRRLVVLALLASACDQGATAAPAPPRDEPPLEAVQPPPPPPKLTIENDQEYVAKALVLVEELLAVFGDGTARDCERLATDIESLAARNVTRVARLHDYSTAHPSAQQALTAALEPRMQELMRKLTPVVSSCASNQRLLDAFKRFEPPQR